MRPLVSVIVPGYNAGKYLAKALLSLINQTYPNIEIIFVNDASADDSSQVAAETLENSGAKYKIIDLERNRGETAARNAGINASSGEFITFLDADDLLGENTIEALCKSAKETSPAADVTICGFRKVDAETKKIKSCPISGKVTSALAPCTIAEMRILSKITPALSVLCGKAFLDANGIRFTEKCQAGGDGEFILKALCASKKTAVCHETGYYYIQNGEMGSRAADAGQRLERYRDHTEAQGRAAAFIIENCSPALKQLASSVMTPLVEMRRLSYWAMRGDKEAFDLALSGLDARLLLKSRECLLKKPEIFCRAAALRLFPEIYYRRYAKRFGGSARC